MKFISKAAIVSLFATAAFAQGIDIGAPPNGTQVTPGQNITVMVITPDSLQSVIQVGLVISFLSCNDSICIPPNEELGTILYNGPYDPVFPSPNPYNLPPHENFTVTIPSGSANGTGQLAATNFDLVGAGHSPTYQIQNITLNVI